MRFALAVVLVAVLAGPAAASAQSDPLAALKQSCQKKRSTDPRPTDRVSYRICTAKIPSFDGIRLDTTLTLPSRVRRRDRPPLIVFLHGFLTTKKEYISETRGGIGPDRGGEAYKTSLFNNVWFASRGYAVLSYSARAHGESEGMLHFADPQHEIRDTRYLTGLLVDDARSALPLVRVNRRKLGVIGGSYGGIQTWLMVTTRDDRRLQYGEWRSPKGQRIRIATAIPQFTASDLFHTIAPNGWVFSTRVYPLPSQPPYGPFGALRFSLVAGLTALTVAATGTDGPKATPELVGYVARANAGEPYDDPDDSQMRGFKDYLAARSAIYQADFFSGLRTRRQRMIPILAPQGWTDPLFHPIESLEMYYRLRRARRGYPIQLYFGDFEHMTALAKIPDLLYYHRLGNRMLDYYLKGKRLPSGRRRRRPKFDVRSALTTCDPKRFGPVVGARSWRLLARRRLTFELGGPRQTAWAVNDQRATTTDPLLLEQQRPRQGRPSRGCITTTLPPTTGVATYFVDIRRAFTMLGLPELTLRYRATGSDLLFETRLWAVAPDGTQTLVSRGAYRAISPRAGGDTATFELFGNHWRFPAGHKLMLEVTQDDSPYFRRNNFPSTTTIDSARLVVPTRSSGS
jgi:predicted acyl esterase